MNVAFFGGTFDPIHKGHIAIARAAREQFKLGVVYFVTNAAPPHRGAEPITDFEHRHAMVALATAGEKGFVPSLLEAPRSTNVLAFASARNQPERPNYSIDSVRKLKDRLRRSDKLYFLVGADAFLGISKWHEPEALLAEVEFIVAARPGYSLADIGGALPQGIRPNAAATKVFRNRPATGEIVLAGATIRLIEDTQERVSATQIRAAAAGKRKLEHLVGDAVADYIRKQGLYRDAERSPGEAPASTRPSKRPK